jgi:hypothetical protein
MVSSPQCAFCSLFHLWQLEKKCKRQLCTVVNDVEIPPAQVLNAQKIYCASLDY